VLAENHKTRRFSMSEKKNLLKEGTVRRFMKLAGNEVVASDFLQETYYNRDENIMEAPEDELGGEEELGLDAGAEELPEEPAGLDMEPEEDLGEEDADEGSVEAFAKDALEALATTAKKHGVDIEVDEAPEPDEIEVGEMEAEGDLEGELGPEEGEMTPEDEDAALQALKEINYIDEDVLMEKVYHRVAKRLNKEKQADKVATVLAEKLASRVSKKLR
jgi:hypothetical protein